MPLEGVTLFTSDARPKYLDDALIVLGSHSGAHYKFRYESKYLPQDTIDHLFSCQNSKKECTILIAFKSKLHSQNESFNFIIPLRWANFLKIRRVGDFYVIWFKIDRYPNIEVPIENLDDIIRCSDKWISEIPEAQQTLPVFSTLLSDVNPNFSNNDEKWISLVKLLSLHPKLQSYHYIRIDSILDQRNIRVEYDNDGYLNLMGSSDYQFNIDYYNNDDNMKPAIIELETNSDYFKLSTGNSILLNSRYDSFTSWLHSKETQKDLYLEVYLKLKLQQGTGLALQLTHILKARLLKSKWKNFLKFATSSFGAVLIAIPGLMPKDTLLFLKLFFVIIGSIILSAGVHYIFPKQEQ